MEIFKHCNFLWKFFHNLIFCGEKMLKFSNKANCYVGFPKKQMLVEIRKAANLCEYFPTKQIIGKIFQQGFFLLLFFNKSKFCGNVLTKQLFAETFQQSEVLWKIFHKGNFYSGNLPKKHFLVETSHKGNFLWKLSTRWQQFLWKFVN